ncbi:putative lipid phosphate phosphatase 3, chloroplastic [Rutidosis leptorrhynchoides]|uniref:putative lipid phosphate phosphatase 3, chloroplastic n=1 Tax=Rutidosis leptorrhynchoides TaxID=125765 RepID=UPI003A991B53
MMDSQRPTHTMKSHGLALARTHMSDWLIISLLVVIMIILSLVHPFNRFVGKDMMTDLKYPLKDSTIPFWTVPLYAVFLPMAIFLAFYCSRRDVYDFHHAVLGLLFSVFITGVITEALKDAVGRPRPDFFRRCFPDGNDLYDQWGEVICHGDINVIRQGHKSFPSGHASWSFAGLGFLSLYLSGKIKAFDREGHAAKLCIVFLPLLAASLVAITRVANYRHHWQDVVVGGLIGITMAIFCYLQYFAPPYHTEGWGPYAYFRALESLYGNTEVSRPPPARTNVCQVEIPQHGRNNNSVLESSLDGSDMSLVDLESGRT